MKGDWQKRSVWWVLAFALGLLLIQRVDEAWVYASAADGASASDSLPLYLGARAVRWGLDPTDASVMQQMYESADLGVTRALFSVLYPPSVHVMLQPVAGLSYNGFLYYWRPVLLLVAVLGTAMAGTVGVKSHRVPLAMAMTALGAFYLFPTFIDVQVALGQPNPLIAGVFGLAIGCAARGWLSMVGAMAALGAGIKLVPAIIGWPLLAARSWRSVGAACGIGVAILAVTLWHVPIDRIVSNLQETAAFQQTVEPHWLHDPKLGDGARFLGFFRRPAMMLITLVFVGWASHRTRNNPTALREAIAVGVAMLAAALSADSAGVGAYYATLAIPGMAVLLSWPLAEGASRWSWIGFPAAFAVFAVVDEGLIYNTPNIEVKLVAASTAIWLGLVLRLANVVRPWSWRAGSGAALVMAAALVHASIWTWRPPFGGHKTWKEAAPGSQTTPSAPPVAPIPHD